VSGSWRLIDAGKVYCILLERVSREVRSGYRVLGCWILGRMLGTVSSLSYRFFIKLLFRSRTAALLEEKFHRFSLSP